jgi:hypothetical protein
MIRGNNRYDLAAWLLAMDLETFGEHGSGKKRDDGPWLLNNLIYIQIPGEGYHAIPLQAVLSGLHEEEFPKVQLAESGSWSCLCRMKCEDIERQLSKRGLLKVYGEYLADFPARLDGVVRWRAPCSCTNNGNFDDNLWKIPFKAGLTQVLEGLTSIYDVCTEDVLNDPVAALNDYLSIKMKAVDKTISKSDLKGFIETHFRAGETSRESVSKVLRLMEGIFYAEAAQTSCGTYWNGPRKMEPMYNVVHAANGVRLFNEALPDNPELQKLGLGLEKALLLSDLENLKVYKETLDSTHEPEHCHVNDIMAVYGD